MSFCFQRKVILFHKTPSYNSKLPLRKSPKVGTLRMHGSIVKFRVSLRPAVKRLLCKGWYLVTVMKPLEQGFCTRVILTKASMASLADSVMVGRALILSPEKRSANRLKN